MRLRDLAAAKRSLIAFSEQINYSLTDWQARALSLLLRVTVIVAGRQLGKSRSLAVLALFWAFRRKGQRILVISAGEEAARRLLSEIKTIATSSPLLAGSVVDELSGLLTLSNGSEIRSVPASERQIRGWAVDLLLCDEAALVPDDLLLGAALPTTAARPDARVVLASSATVATGAFFEFARQGETGSEHVETFRWVSSLVGGSEVAPWMSASAIEVDRESMSEARFRAEHLADFASGADALITPAALQRRIADYNQLSLAMLGGAAGFIGGIDWGGGLGVDVSVLVALGRPLIEGPPRLAVACAHAWHASTTTDQMVSDIAATSSG